MATEIAARPITAYRVLVASASLGALSAGALAAVPAYTTYALLSGHATLTSLSAVDDVLTTAWVLLVAGFVLGSVAALPLILIGRRTERRSAVRAGFAAASLAVLAGVLVLGVLLPRTRAAAQVARLDVPFAEALNVACVTPFDTLTADLGSPRGRATADALDRTSFAGDMTAGAPLIETHTQTVAEGIQLLQSLHAPQSRDQALLAACTRSLQDAFAFLAQTDTPYAPHTSNPFAPTLSDVSAINLLKDAAILSAAPLPSGAQPQQLPQFVVATLDSGLAALHAQGAAIHTLDGQLLQADNRQLGASVAPLSVQLALR